MSDYRISKRGLDEIKKSEKLMLKAYQDLRGIWTIGYGHTGKVGGKAIGAGMVITEAEAEQLLADDLARFEKAVRRNVKVPLNQSQYDSLVSLSFNIGDGAFKDSSLLRRLNQGDYQAAADQFLVWNKANGEISKGLANRRERERSMFLGQEYQPNQKTNIIRPTNVDEVIDAPVLPKSSPQWLNAFSPPKEEQPTNPLQAFTDGFNQLNGTLDTFAPPEEPAIDYKKKYQKELANAFGIEPSTKEMIPDHIGDLVRSIYDQTT